MMKSCSVFSVVVVRVSHSHHPIHPFPLSLIFVLFLLFQLTLSRACRAAMSLNHLPVEIVINETRVYRVALAETKKKHRLPNARHPVPSPRVPTSRFAQRKNLCFKRSLDIFESAGLGSLNQSGYQISLTPNSCAITTEYDGSPITAVGDTLALTCP